MHTLKRKNIDEEQPRKRKSWASPPSSSVTYIRPTIESLIAALQDDTQERDTLREPSNNAGFSTVTTTTTTTTALTTSAKETEVEKKAEVVSEGRAHHPEVRPRPNHKTHNGKSCVKYQTHWKVSRRLHSDILRLYFWRCSFFVFLIAYALLLFPTFRNGAFARNIPMETGSLARNLSPTSRN